MRIEDLLKSKRYQEIIGHLKENGIAMVADNEPYRLTAKRMMKDRIKQRQFVLEGFRCKLQTEEEAVDWLNEQLAYKDELLSFMYAVWQYQNALNMGEEYPAGEELDDEDLPEVIETRGYLEEAVALHCIELDLLRNHPQKLGDYYKRIRLPYAAKRAAMIKRLYKQITR